MCPNKKETRFISRMIFIATQDLIKRYASLSRAFSLLSLFCYQTHFFCFWTPSAYLLFDKSTFKITLQSIENDVSNFFGICMTCFIKETKSITTVTMVIIIKKQKT